MHERKEEMEDGVSERQKRGTTFHSLSLCVILSQSLSISLTLSFASLSAPAARRSFTAAV